MNTLVSKLIENNYKIALTESCTGGAFAHKFTRISGSSKYFVGSIVAYHKDVKTVSAEVFNLYEQNFKNK